MSMNLVTLLYLIASVCFIQALKGLSHPTTSRRGNLFGMVGMAIAVATTVGLVFKLGAEIATTGVGYIVVGLLVGGTAGSIMAKRVEMTKMPELVAFMHSMIGLAAVFIAIAAVVEPQSLGIVAHLGDTIPTGNRLELFLGAAIGAITFSGSVIAFGKLSGKYKFRLFQGTPVQFSGQHLLNLVLGLATLGLGLVFMFTGNLTAFAVMLALAFVLGVLIIIPIGGADMPVVVSMLNSYSGWAAAGIGFSLNNSMLIIAGSLVGSSGAILSYIMCKAMNRSFFNVILGGGGGAAPPPPPPLLRLAAPRPYNDGPSPCVEPRRPLPVGTTTPAIDVSPMPFSVPTHLSNPLRRFARRLVPDAAPEVAAPLPMPESLAGEPWFSVGRAVEALGGERVDGWILEEWRGLALRARFSACWRDPRGNLWNVLPQAGAIAFLADPQRRYEGVPLADQYQALSRDVLLEDYLGLRRQLARAGLDDEARERLAGMAARLESWLALGGRGDQACPCGSGKRYRNCCSRLVASAS